MEEVIIVIASFFVLSKASSFFEDRFDRVLLSLEDQHPDRVSLMLVDQRQ